MRWFPASCILLSLTILTSAEWSWGKDGLDDSVEEETVSRSDLLEGEKLPEAESRSDQSNSTVLDDIVDELYSSKQGRSLGGYDDVYSDPTIKGALDADDPESRNVIKDRLCTLGLVQCDEQDSQEKRFVSPDELIYAQPVDITPVGKPIASVQIRGPPRSYGTYGPAKPMPYPRPPHKTPPKRVSYGSTYGSNVRPGFADKYGSSGNIFASNNGLYSGHDSNYVTRPPTYANESPYLFESPKPTYNKVPPVTQSGTKTETVVQQHVHHHYVHEDNKDPKVIIKPVAIPVGSVGQLGTTSPLSLHSSQQTADIITAGGGDYSGGFTGGFKPMTAGYNLDNTETIYGSQYDHNFNKDSSNIFSQSLPKPGNTYEDQKYGNSLGAYGSQNTDFYKKELHVGPANDLYNQGSATFGQSNGYQENYHEAKAQNLDCVCVNIDQCPSQEIIGRRDDLYLPIDPRNKGGEIAALTEDQLDKLGTPETEDKINDNVQNATETETIKINKRDVSADKKDDESANAEPRLIGLAGYGGHGGDGNKQVQPTFGVSFGLPQPSHSGYPINPFNANPIHNPYGPALNGGGLNLGLVSVNPLLAVQVTKNDYGEKIVKPFVNLHVTPNEHVVNKLGHLFHDKKLYLLNKHEHYHNHDPHNYGHYHSVHKPIYPPYYAHPPPPQLPSHHGPPVYSPHYNHYDIGHNQYDHFNVQPHNIHQTAVGNDDYYDDDNSENGDDYHNGLHHGFYNPGFERSANNSYNNDNQGYANRFAYSRSLTLPSKNPGANRGGQTVRFPTNRKKRDVAVEKSNENIDERRSHNPSYFERPNANHIQQCKQNKVCCRRPLQPQAGNRGQCGIRHSQGINGRIKTPSYVDGDSEFGEYPWQAAILKKDTKESVFACGGTLIDHYHIMTAAHCIKSYKSFELRVRLGEWDVNHDVEFYPYIERDVMSVHVHPQYYAGTLDNDLAILKMDQPVDWTKYPHISPACLPDKYTDYAGQRCWTTGWGKDAFGGYGKYQNILKEVDVPILGHGQCQQQLRQTRLGYNYELNPGFLCAGGEEGKDACKGDGGGPLVCERGGTWQLVGVVSWGIGCGERGVPGVYVKVAHYLDWISQITGRFSPY